MFEDAIALLSYACSVYSSGTLCLLLGVAFLRVDQLESAEYAIAEANLLNPRNPEGWAYSSLVCLLAGRERLEEADECLRRALELDLAHSALLRELATLNMAIDRLPTAEDLIRRAIRYENRQNAYSKKLLADVMTSQSQAKAVYE
jgi:Flp pilus assembly protein TadD